MDREITSRQVVSFGRQCYREFYTDGKKVAAYRVRYNNMFSPYELEVCVYHGRNLWRQEDNFCFTESELRRAPEAVRERLRRELPRDLADTIFHYLKRDLRL